MRRQTWKGPTNFARPPPRVLPASAVQRWTPKPSNVFFPAGGPGRTASSLSRRSKVLRRARTAVQQGKVIYVATSARSLISRAILACRRTAGRCRRGSGRSDHPFARRAGLCSVTGLERGPGPQLGRRACNRSWIGPAINVGIELDLLGEASLSRARSNVTRRAVQARA